MPDDMIGHNNPPPFDQQEVDDFLARAKEFGGVSRQWGESGIQNHDDAERINDFISGVHGLWKEVDAARKTAKAPHDAAGKAVQTAYAAILDPLKGMKDKANALRTNFLQKLQREAEEKARREREEAERLAAEAERQRKEAEKAGDEFAKAEADRIAKEAVEREKAAEKAAKVNVASASGAGRAAALRTYRRAEIVSIRQLFLHYERHPDVADLLLRLANADVRAKHVDDSAIPGIRIIEEQRAA